LGFDLAFPPEAIRTGNLDLAFVFVVKGLTKQFTDQATECPTAIFPWVPSQELVRKDTSLSPLIDLWILEGANKRIQKWANLSISSEFADQ
jgi:hypothetical protein